MRSSYCQNGYGKIFERIIYAYTPQKCVELGVLDGYSTLHIAKGMQHTLKVNHHLSHLNSYDLWDDYEYKHGDKASVQKMLVENKVEDFVTLYKEDAYKVADLYTELSICIVHIDISNTGKILRDMVDLWYPKLAFSGLILFEGGSEERDNVEWMAKFNKPKIKPELESNKFIKEKFIYGTYHQFPSLTVLRKKA